mmetsp:Transcript_31671/g.75978  ORF Transcript_31671/g.75978 Transcript_31671/m.75978 type:complete len:297 (-) Transcript_31671:989-1879(-)
MNTRKRKLRCVLPRRDLFERGHGCGPSQGTALRAMAAIGVAATRVTSAGPARPAATIPGVGHFIELADGGLPSLLGTCLGLRAGLDIRLAGNARQRVLRVRPPALQGGDVPGAAETDRDTLRQITHFSMGRPQVAGHLGALGGASPIFHTVDPSSGGLEKIIRLPFIPHGIHRVAKLQRSWFLGLLGAVQHEPHLVTAVSSQHAFRRHVDAGHPLHALQGGFQLVDSRLSEAVAPQINLLQIRHIEEHLRDLIHGIVTQPVVLEPQDGDLLMVVVALHHLDGLLDFLGCEIQALQI